VARAMCAAYELAGLACVATVARIDRLGARVETSASPVAAGRS
jgi:hypothetical protein